MKLAFSTLGCPDWTLKEIFSTAKDFGFDGVEIRGVKNELVAPKIPDFSEEKLPATLERMNALGLEIPCITSGICVRDYSVKNADGIISEAVKYAELADRVGADFVRILPDIDTAPGEPVSDEAVTEGFREIINASKDSRAVFLAETNGAFADTRRLANIIEKVGSERLGVLWDVHHPYRFFGEQPSESYRNIGENLKYVHIKDSALAGEGKIQYKMMGKGDMPLREIIGVLKENYDGYISLEWVKRWCRDLEAPGIVFVQYINYMKKLKEQA